MFRLHYITMYFADIKFPNKESMTIQSFAFSRFKKQTSKSSWMPGNLDMDYKRNTKWGPDLISKVLPYTATFKFGLTCWHNTHEMIFQKQMGSHSYKLRGVPGPTFKLWERGVSGSGSSMKSNLETNVYCFGVIISWLNFMWISV